MSFFRKVKAVPRWGWIFGIVYFILQYSLYRLAEWLSRVLGTVAWAIPVKIPVIDDLIPVVPIFALVYLFSYIFWICGPPAVSLTGRAHFTNYICALSLAYLIGFLIFVLLPTYMDRVEENLIAYTALPGFGYRLLGLIYAADGSERAFNLFPSYHCLISACCYLGIRKRPEISKGFRIYSLVMALLISASTVLTKQHYFVDILGGWAIALFSFRLMDRLDPGREREHARS